MFKHLIIAVIFLLTSCGSISKIKSSSKIDLGKYERVVIMDFDNKTGKAIFIDQNKTPINQSFPDKIYHQLHSSPEFADINLIKTKSANFISKGNLVITGEITKADDGNDVLRGIFGLWGRSRLTANIDFIDGNTKKSIAQIEIKKASLAFGLFISANQNLEYLIQDSANNVSDKIKKLK